MKQLYFIITILSLLLFGCLEDPEMNTGLQNALKPEFEKFSGDDITKTATTILAKATIKKALRLLNADFSIGKKKVPVPEKLLMKKKRVKEHIA